MKPIIFSLTAAVLLLPGCSSPSARHHTRVERRDDRHERTGDRVEGRHENRADRRVDRYDRLNTRY
jgi:hypothetical protein